MSREAAPILTAEAISALLRDGFPEMFGHDPDMRIEAVGPMSARVRLRVGPMHLRPGGTVSGPTIFTLADVALYVAILAQIGPHLHTVTTGVTINFLRRPPKADLVADCTLLKLGRRLAVGEVRVSGVNGGPVVAHATGTYALPASVAVP